MQKSTRKPLFALLALSLFAVSLAGCNHASPDKSGDSAPTSIRAKQNNGNFTKQQAPPAPPP